MNDYTYLCIFNQSFFFIFLHFYRLKYFSTVIPVYKQILPTA